MSTRTYTLFPFTTLFRSLMERVVTLGHVDWRTTIRSYLHLPWLMRSRQDRALADTYMHRREVAFAMGVSLPAVDKITQQTKHRSEEHTSELQSLIRISYAIFCSKKKTINIRYNTTK